MANRGEEPAQNPDETAKRVVRLIFGVAVAAMAIQIVWALVKSAL